MLIGPKSLALPPGQPKALAQVRTAPLGGAPFRIVIDGVTYERVTLDGAFVTLDNQPVYMQVS